MLFLDRTDLQQWWKTLNDKRVWYFTPEAECSDLLDAAMEMYSKGLVDDEQYLEMRDLVIGARDHGLDVLASTWWHCAGRYEVYSVVDNSRLGQIDRGAFHPAEGADGLAGTNVHFTAEGRLVLGNSNYRKQVGTVEGRTLTLLDGRQFWLDILGRHHAGQLLPAIDDADVYRATIERARYLAEQSDPASASVKRRLEISSLEVCPICRATFALEEDCTACAGIGVVDQNRPAGSA